MDIRGERKKLIVITVIIATILLLSGTVTYLYFNSKENEGYLTVKEVMVDRNGSDWFLPNGTVFHIRDKVIQTNTFRLPEPVIIKHNDSTDFYVNMSDIRTYTVVFFESIPTYPLIFSGNRTYQFQENKVIEFELKVREYPDEDYGNASGVMSCIEPVYNLHVMVDYIESSIVSGHFSYVSLDMDDIGNGTFILKVKDLFLPTDTPIYWSTVTYMAIPEDYWTKVNPEIQLFSSEGKFLGNIGKERNPSLNKEIEVGDYLVVSNITGNISFRLEGDAFSSFDSPATYPGTNDLFHTQTLTAISLHISDAGE